MIVSEPWTFNYTITSNNSVRTDLICQLLTVQLETLQQSASRHLVAALTLFAGTYPLTLMNSVIVPVVSSESCNTFQADVVLKLVKTVPNSDHYAQLLRWSAYFDFHAGYTTGYRVVEKNEKCHSAKL